MAAAQARARHHPGASRARQTANNLPAHVSSFVGREREVDSVRHLVDDHRLITLIGVGGIGKTRIARHAALGLLEVFEGVWFVDFTPINDASLVPIAVLAALNIPESLRRSPLQTVLTFLKNKRVLLILDNCEHVIQGAATAAQEILLNCPTAHILATSRELLGIAGEKIVRVPTLSVPSPDVVRELTPDETLKFGAIALFVDRAADADSRFQLEEHLIAPIVEICSHLDGIALAIELAAAQVGLLSVPVLARKLSERLFISGGKRTAPPRHRTMRALLDWSYELLGESEQRILRRLSVFAGGFTLELAAALGVGEGPMDESSMLELLSALADKSLLQCELKYDTIRYRLLEPTRQYASEKLRQHGEVNCAARAHALAFVALIERFSSWDFIPDHVWQTQVQFEHPNWRMALQWAFGPEGDLLVGQRLAAEFVNVLYTIESTAEDMRWVRRAIETCDEATPPSVRAKLEVAQVIISLPLGRLLSAETTAAAQRALRLFEEAGDPLGVAIAQLFIGEGLIHKQRIPEAENLLRAALTVAEAAGAQRLIAYITRTLSIARAAAGDLDSARELMRGVLEMYESAKSGRQQAMLRVTLAEFEFRAGDPETALDVTLGTVESTRQYNLPHYLALTLNNAAAYAVALSRFEEARGYAREAMLLSVDAGFNLQLAWASQHLGAIGALLVVEGQAQRQGDLRRAARALGFTASLMTEVEGSRRYLEQQEYEKITTLLRSQLGTEYDDLTAEGATWSLERGLEELLKI